MHSDTPHKPKAKLGRRAWIIGALVLGVLLTVPIFALLVFPSPGTKAESSSRAQAREDDPRRPRALGQGKGTEETAEPDPDEERSVSGQVIDAEGKPVENATVRCSLATQAAKTDAEGAFTITLSGDACDAKAEHKTLGYSDSVHIKVGGKNVIVMLSPGGIDGVVVDEEGNAVRSYLVAVEAFTAVGQQPDLNGGASQIVNDKAGKFAFSSLAPGHYTLTASSESRPPTRSEGIDVEAGHVTHGVRITLLSGITVSGIVTDHKTNKPLANVAVSLDGLTHSEADATSSTTTASDGSYSLDGAPKGHFSVRFALKGYRDRIESLDGTGLSEVKSSVDLSDIGSGKASLEISNVGAMLSQGVDDVTVGALISDGPAAKAGVLVQDKVIAIDGKSIAGLTMDDCVQRLRGPVGSTVELQVERAGKTIDFNLTRALVSR